MFRTKYIIDPIAREILEFWFDEKTEKKWWVSNKNFDNEIKTKYETIYERARKGAYDSWVEFPEELLALVILLDQFPRNMYRNTERAFLSDQEALEICKFAITYKMDYKITEKKHRHFLYMPLMHSEDIGDQKLSVEKFANISKEAYEAAISHKEVIDKFGRFPHRNLLISRNSTKDEEDFLQSSNLASWAK